MLQRLFFFALYFLSLLLHAQSKFILPSHSKGKVAYELASNVIIIPIEIEGVELSFLVDTGVGRTLIFDTHKAKQLGFEQDNPVYLSGLGDQPSLEAYQVTLPRLNISDIYIDNMTALVLPDNEFILSKRVGTHIDGIIGYELFAHYPVLIDYVRKIIQINPQKKYERWRRKEERISPLYFHNLKPYVALELPVAGKANLKGMFLLDTSLNDALWLFSNAHKLEKHQPVFDDFLGTGINGDVYGLRGKIPHFEFGQVNLKQVKVAYPEEHTYKAISLQPQRLGSVGAELMRRYRLIFDYPNNQLLIKTTAKTADPFYYNLSGIELAYEGVRMVRERLPSVQRHGTSGNEGIEILLQDRYELSFVPALKITYVRPNSAAHKVGVKAGDELLEINGKKVHLLSFKKVIRLLQKGPDEKIRLTINRENQQRKFSFCLSSIFND